MSRHVKTIWAKSFDGNIESDPVDTLSRKIYDTLNGKTTVSMAVTRYGIYIVAVLVYDDS